MNDKKILILVCCIGVFIGFPVAHFGHIKYTDPIKGSASFFEKVISSPPNEIGDTLVGVFGTLAFFAASVALLMQTRELSAQRSELSLMRSEYRLQRIANQKSAEVLVDEKASRFEASYARLFEALQEKLEAEIRYIWRYVSIQSPEAPPEDKASQYPFEKQDASFSREQVFLEFLHQVFTIEMLHSSKFDSEYLTQAISCKSNFQTIVDTIDIINKNTENFGSDIKVRLEASHLGTIQYYTKKLLDKDVWVPDDVVYKNFVSIME